MIELFSMAYLSHTILRSVWKDKLFINAVSNSLFVKTKFKLSPPQLNFPNLRLISNLSDDHHVGDHSDNVTCWKCGVKVDKKKILFCEFCKVIQKPDASDHFEIMGISKSFDVNPAELTQNFRKLQMQLHPDRFTQKAEEEKLVSEGYSTLLNTAYKTLLSPLERGMYILELEGFPIVEGELVMTPEFLMEVMEVNEEIDDAENSEELQTVKETNILRVQELYRKVGEQFRNQNWETARELMSQLRYFTNIQQKIKEKEGEIQLSNC